MIAARPGTRGGEMLAKVQRHLLWRRRLRAVRDWQEAERQQAVEYSATIGRILNQTTEIRDQA